MACGLICRPRQPRRSFASTNFHAFHVFWNLSRISFTQQSLYCILFALSRLVRLEIVPPYSLHSPCGSFKSPPLSPCSQLEYQVRLQRISMPSPSLRNGP